MDNPFGGLASIALLRKEDFPGETRFGTYGVIRGGDYYLVGISGSRREDQVSMGYMLEKVVLFCTALGLGTVWLGGSINKKDFKKVLSLPLGQEVQIVVPFGYEGGKKTLLAGLMEKMAKSREKRKPFEELFFLGSLASPLSIEEARELGSALEMVRLAPSAMNKQPWRAVLHENETVDFYIAEEGNFSWVDLGIGLAHFALTLEEEGKSIRWERKKEVQEALPRYWVTADMKQPGQSE